MALTDKQAQFVREYMIDLNGTQAAIRAGYAPKRANVEGSRLLSNVNVRACLDVEMAERSRRTGVNADRVVRELAKIAFVNAPDIINVDSATVRGDAGRDDTACILSVKVKTVTGQDVDSVEREIKLCDKTRALELLGRHMGMFNDKLELTAPVTVVIKDDYGEDTGVI